MSQELPTKLGPYYWRESDGDEWEIHTVFIDDELNNTLMALCPIDDTWYATENRGGQWLPIPTADELVELKAKAKMVDEGIDAWAVFTRTTHEMIVSWQDKGESQEMCDNMNRMSSKHRYTCEPVTIIRNQKQK